MTRGGGDDINLDTVVSEATHQRARHEKALGKMRQAQDIMALSPTGSAQTLMAVFDRSNGSVSTLEKNAAATNIITRKISHQPGTVD